MSDLHSLYSDQTDNVFPVPAWLLELQAAMQTPAWAGVPPAMLYRIVASLRAVGLAGEARMIAAEAIARA